MSEAESMLSPSEAELAELERLCKLLILVNWRLSKRGLLPLRSMSEAESMEAPSDSDPELAERLNK
jgi:hypothetical protein